jgi:hypothetical protein
VKLDPEVYSLCDEAKVRLEKVKREVRDKINSAKHEASTKKKDIVINLAKALEHKIRLDTISATIV